MTYKIFYTKAAPKDAVKLKRAGLDDNCRKLLSCVAQDPFMPSPPFEELVGDLQGLYSRRINLQHRLVYEVDEQHRTIKILRMWTHYA